MPFSIGSSGSSSNPSLAWVMGNRGKGRMIIKFPLPLDKGWYHEQPCTKFHTLEHRKERSGFQHEFIVLKLLDGSVCRIERMGDPNARFEALSPRGTVAHDMAQCFRPDELDQACLDTSDTIAEVRLPYDFDLMDVLKVCRAIQEGEKTCNYTLQVFNCFFFALAIQACLVRLVAHWENQELLRIWLLRVQKGVRTLKTSLESDVASNAHALHRMYSAIASVHKHLPSSFEREVRQKLQCRWRCLNSTKRQKHLARHVNKVLWHSDIRLGLEQFVEDEVRRAMTDVLKEISNRTRSTRADLLLLLAELVTPDRTSPSAVGFAINQKQLNQRKSKPDLIVAELTFKKVQTSHTREITMDWFQWISGGMAYVWHLALWVLYVAPSPLLKVGQSHRGILDQKLGSIATELQGFGNPQQSKLKEIYLEMKTLVQSDLRAATWGQNPWTTLCHLVMHNLSKNMLEDIGLNQTRLVVGIEAQPQPMTSSLPVSDFQDHILARIRIHAELVQSVWLGSSTNIEAELKSTLSQVWGSIREDDTLIKKEIYRSNPTDPLVNSARSTGPPQSSTISGPDDVPAVKPAARATPPSNGANVTPTPTQPAPQAASDTPRRMSLESTNPSSGTGSTPSPVPLPPASLSAPMRAPRAAGPPKMPSATSLASSVPVFTPHGSSQAGKDRSQTPTPGLPALGSSSPIGSVSGTGTPGSSSIVPTASPNTVPIALAAQNALPGSLMNPNANPPTHHSPPRADGPIADATPPIKLKMRGRPPKVRTPEELAAIEEKKNRPKGKRGGPPKKLKAEQAAAAAKAAEALGTTAPASTGASTSIAPPATTPETHREK